MFYSDMFSVVCFAGGDGQAFRLVMFSSDMFSGVCLVGGDGPAARLVMFSNDMFFLLYVLQVETVRRFVL